jgi:hypothetical protein
VSTKSWPPSYLHEYQQYQTYFYIKREDVIGTSQH